MLLQGRDIQIQVIDYLKTPPSPAEIDAMLKLLGLEPREFMRRNEDAYREHHADDPGQPRATLLELMHAHPELIQRPVVFAGGKARIGRPPEAVLEIL